MIFGRLAHRTASTYSPSRVFGSARLLGVANGLTVLRFLLIVPLVYLVAESRHAAALGVYGLALMTDILDGPIARHRAEESALGRLLDPLADIASTTALFGALWLQGAVPGWLWGMLLLRYFSLLTGIAAIYRILGPFEIRATPTGKIVGVLQGAAGIMILALMASGVQWQENIEVTLFLFLGIIFGWVIVSQLLMGIHFSRMTPNVGSRRQSKGF